jgi:hypothetical protein
MKHKDHIINTKARLGNGYKEIHRAIDKPYAYLGGRHRVLFHDKLTPLFIYLLTGDEKKMFAAISHYVDDYSPSSNNNGNNNSIKRASSRGTRKKIRQKRQR